MNELIGFLAEYGLEPIIMALCINFMTWLVKLPIKAMASKLKNSASVTRFIVFAPVILGFLLAMLYTFVANRTLKFDEAFYKLWLTSSSLSLTFYAVFEKLIPTKTKLIGDDEVEANKKLISELEVATGVAEDNGDKPTSGIETGNRSVAERKHFILGRKGDDQTEIKK